MSVLNSRNYRRLFITTGTLVGLLTPVSAFAAANAPEPEMILKKTDAIRNPDESFIMNVEIQSSGETKSFEVATKGNNRTFVKTLSPARDKGRDMLMVDENMWAFVPNLKRAVRVNLSQKLSGEAANGDISRMRWAADYAAKIESETPKEWVLFLDAKKKGLTYEKIRAWIEKSTYRPLRAEYLSVGGKPLKKAAFGEYKPIAGATRPTLIDIEDAVRPDQKSAIRITTMEVKDLPDGRFSLERFQTR